MNIQPIRWVSTSPEVNAAMPNHLDVTDRTGIKRHHEDEEGFFEFESLYKEKPVSSPE